MSPDQRAQNVLKPHGNALAFVFGPRTERCGLEQTVAGHLLPIPHRTDTCSLPWRMPNSSEWGCNACAGDRPGSATSRAASTGLVHAWPCFLKPGSRAIFACSFSRFNGPRLHGPRAPCSAMGLPAPRPLPLTPYPLPLAMAAAPVTPCANRDPQAAYCFKASAQSFRPRGGQRVSMARPGRTSVRDALI